MPSLAELRERILSTTQDDWHEIEAGPYFTDAPDIDKDTFDQHMALLVYRDDVSLTIQWGMDARSHVGRLTDLADIWPDAHFPDASIRVYFADVFWNGTLIDREHIVSVDGGRARLPLGRREAPGYDHTRDEPPVWVYTATRWQTGLARLLDSGHDFERYFAQTGMTVSG